MIYYLDASALTKVYAYEKGSEVMEQFLNSDKSFYSSVVIYPELLLALRRKLENKEINNADFTKQIDFFENHFQNLINHVEFHKEILNLLKTRILQHSMKALDAIHLVSALWVQENIDNECIFVCSDTNLIKFAKLESLKVFNPEK